MSDPQPLDYAQTQRRPLDVRTHILTTIMATVCVAVPTFILVMVVPRFEMIFKDFKTELPGVTQFVLSLSRWTVNYGWVFLPLIIVTVVVPGLLLDHGSPTDQAARRYRRMVTILLVLAMLAFIAIVVLACFMPMMSGINSVSGASAKR